MAEQQVEKPAYSTEQLCMIYNTLSDRLYEVERFRRLFRKRGSFTEYEFDVWFRSREFRRPIQMSGISGDSMLLGLGGQWIYVLGRDA